MSGILLMDAAVCFVSGYVIASTSVGKRWLRRAIAGVAYAAGVAMLAISVVALFGGLS